MVRVCEHCHEEIQVKSAGDESWDWCDNCEIIEGGTVELTEEDFEKAHG